MSVVIDYSPKFEAAKKYYELFETVYRSTKKSEVNNRSLGETTEKFVKGVVYETLKFTRI
ncbi:MAG: hypothetical protein DRP06_02075 [Candidatus Aenigmatarchaeota archaeon]|nr:MAG: hypothetical protein DRP06_02075 [Candidatus Aenigmarchaeota archaeon]